MDNKQIEEGIKALEDLADASPTAEIEITLEDKNALISAISILKLVLSVSKAVPKKKDFEYYLTEKHAEQYIGTKDCMIDDFNKWVEDLGIDFLIEYANKFYNLCHDEFTAWLVGRMDKIKEIIQERLQYYVDTECPTADDLATAIKTMIMGGE